MPSSYTDLLRLTKPADGELVGTWGQTVNNGITELEEDAIAGTATVAMGDADKTLTIANGATDQARSAVIALTGAMTAQRSVVCPSSSKTYIVRNNTTGGFGINFKTLAGTGVVVAAGTAMLVYCDGVNVVQAVSDLGPTSAYVKKSGDTMTGGLSLAYAGIVGVSARSTSANSYAAVLLMNELATFSRAMQMEYTGTAYPGGSGDPAGEYGMLKTTGAFPMLFGTSNLERMQIASGGNVAVGMTPPAAALVPSFFVGHAAITGWRAPTNLQTALARNLYFDDAAAWRYLQTDTSGGSAMLQTDQGFTFFMSPSGTAGAAAAILIGMQIDKRGNVGIGATPPVWGGSFRALQVVNQTFFTHTDGSTGYHAQNTYFDGSAWNMLVTGAASMYSQSAGGHAWFSAVSAAAGAPTALVQRMKLDAVNNLIVGAAFPAAWYPADGGTFSINGPTASLVGLGVGSSTAGYLAANASVFSINAAGLNLPLVFGANGGEHMRIASTSGNLGIKSLTPGYTVQLGDGGVGSPRRTLYAKAEYNFSGTYVGTGPGNNGGMLELVAHGDSNNSRAWRLYHDVNATSTSLSFDYANITSTYASLTYTRKLLLTEIGRLYANGIELGFRNMQPVRGLLSGPSTLAEVDRGGMHYKTDNTSVTVPSGVFALGDVVTILNWSINNMAIVLGAGMSLYKAGTNSAVGPGGTITLNGVCAVTIVFQSPNGGIISGAGMS